MTAKQHQQRAWFLIAVCVLMMVVSVLPHHHHWGMSLCMHDRVEACAADCTDDACHRSSTDGCSADCVTKFSLDVPQRDSGLLTPPITFLTESLFLSSYFYWAGFVDEDEAEPSVYIEPLHGFDVPIRGGLRAPPQA